jgi:hypothetical protein
MAGFEVTFYGRFWVTPEVSVPDVVTRREFATTLKPAARNPLVKPRPMPLEAPVITAVCLWLLVMVTQMELSGMRFDIPTPGV